MGKIFDTMLSWFGQFLLFLGRGARSLWWGKRHYGRPNTSAMPLTDGHGRWRNMPCFCRSGLKFKRCHGATEQQKEYWRTQRERHLNDLRVRNFVKYGGLYSGR